MEKIKKKDNFIDRVKTGCNFNVKWPTFTKAN